MSRCGGDSRNKLKKRDGGIDSRLGAWTFSSSDPNSFAFIEKWYLYIWIISRL